MSNTVRDMLLGRWKFGDVPRLRPIRTALESALDALDAVRGQADQITKKQNLSALGQLDEVRAFISKTTAPAIHRSRAVAKSARDDVAAWRTRLLPKTPDPKDLAAAMLRSELRTYLRQMPLGSRFGHLIGENAEQNSIQAVLEAPPFASGVTEEMREKMVEGYVNRTHPNELAQIAQVEEALELLNAATGIVFNTAKSVAEFPSERVFSDFINKAAPETKPSPGSPLAKPAPTTDSDAIYERLLAEGRAELAAIDIA